MPTLTVIVPCYNEGARILTVIEAILGCSLVTEIIVVDDGSNAETREILTGLSGDRVFVLHHPANRGKAAAMLTGLTAALGELVLFVDADLHGLTPQHIRRLVTPVAAGLCDMTLGVRQHECWYARLIGMSAAFTGERCFDKATLISNRHVFEAQGYNVEASINRVYRFPYYKSRRVFMRGVGQTAKIRKTGLRGLLDSFRMIRGIVRYAGLGGFIRQVYRANRLPME